MSPRLLCSPSRKPQGHRCPDAIVFQLLPEDTRKPATSRPRRGSRCASHGHSRAGAIRTRGREEQRPLVEGRRCRDTLGGGVSQGTVADVSTGCLIVGDNAFEEWTLEISPNREHLTYLLQLKEGAGWSPEVGPKGTFSGSPL